MLNIIRCQNKKYTKTQRMPLSKDQMEKTNSCRFGIVGRSGKLRSSSTDAPNQPLLGRLRPTNGGFHLQHGRHSHATPTAAGQQPLAHLIGLLVNPHRVRVFQSPSAAPLAVQLLAASPPPSNHTPSFRARSPHAPPTATHPAGFQQVRGRRFRVSKNGPRMRVQNSR